MVKVSAGWEGSEAVEKLLAAVGMLYIAKKGVRFGKRGKKVALSIGERKAILLDAEMELRAAVVAVNAKVGVLSTVGDANTKILLSKLIGDIEYIMEDLSIAIKSRKTTSYTIIALADGATKAINAIQRALPPLA